jgi:NADH-ubiquinone oxidoreductase chain 5
MSLPLFILGVLSIFLGYISKDFFVGLASQGFGNSLYSTPIHSIINDTEFGIPIIYKLLPLILSIILAIIALYLFEKKSIILIKFNISKFGRNVYRFFNQRY